MDDAFRRAKRQYDADPKNPDTQQQYCRAYARAGYPGKSTKKCLAPWCNAAVKQHQLCMHHRKPAIYDALGLPPKLEFPADWQYLVECTYETEYSCSNKSNGLPAQVPAVVAVPQAATD